MKVARVHGEVLQSPVVFQETDDGARKYLDDPVVLDTVAACLALHLVHVQTLHLEQVVSLDGTQQGVGSVQS